MKKDKNKEVSKNQLSVTQQSCMSLATSPFTHCQSYFIFSMREALKIAILFLGMALKSYILWCSRGYCAVPTFLRVFPVSAPCLSSSFKSIYCSQKSIRLSEERCRFWGYGSLLSHFLPLFLIHKKNNNKKKKVKAELPACPFFFGWWQRGRGVTHHWKRAGASRTFSLDSQINGTGLPFSKPDTPKAFLC